LHLLLENPESLIHIVFANEYLQVFSDLVVAVAPCVCRWSTPQLSGGLDMICELFPSIPDDLTFDCLTLIEGSTAGAFDSGDMNEPVLLYKNFIAR
jgi:hypothetical protein